MTSAGARCPSCNAHVTAGSDWCTLCYTDLRPAPEPQRSFAVPVMAVQDAPSAAYDETAPALTAEEHQQEAVQAAELMLAQLAAESDAPLKSLAGNFQTGGAKVALIAGGLVVVAVVLFGLMALIGTLLPAS